MQFDTVMYVLLMLRRIVLLCAAAGGLHAQVSGTVTANEGTVSVSGAYSGSVPAANLPPGPIRLTLADAIQRGLSANLGAIDAGIDERAARANRLEALSALLPDIYAQASDTVTQVNLAAYGFQFKLPPNSGFSIPTVVGPYNYSGISGNLSMPIWDPVKRRQLQEAKENERAAALNGKDARELVVLAVAGSYLQTLAYASRVDAQKAEVASAQAVYQQAVTRKEAGTNARIDVTRSEVELETEQQRLNTYQADLDKQLLTLARVIGLPQDHELVLSEALQPTPGAVPDVAQAIQQAESARSDIRAAESQLKAAELAFSAARAERLPSATLNGDYGTLGPSPEHQHGVFAVTGAVNIPIYRSGRMRADEAQAEATIAQRRADLADRKAAVEQQIREALIELKTANGQVTLAQNNRDYAHDTLQQARDRFAAGVSTTLEVVQAQQQVAAADENYINSLFGLDVARVSLARAMGQVENQVPALLQQNPVQQQEPK